MTEMSEFQRKIVGGWLLVICGMVFAMVVLGGFTRLTESGLSMTNWRPVTGWLPPFSTPEWLMHFDAYRTSPEYLKVNRGMSLGEFKGIFWLEYLHRLWGRVIGLAFAIPFAVFFIKGWLSKAWCLRFGFLFLLGGFQGVIGWWMVKSGLVDRPDVSQYRLAIHLIVAFAIMAISLWFALDILGSARQVAPKRIQVIAKTILGLSLVTVFSGALVAGLNAGMIYNTFPLMLGEVFPSEGFQLSPWYLNIFEDIPTVQFDHRLLAMTTLILIVVNWFVTRHVGGIMLRRATWLLAIAFLQVGLGISTLLLVVPIQLAIAHQACAALLIGVAIWFTHGLSGPHDK